MKQRVLYELREAWNKLLHWEIPSVDDLRPPQRDGDDPAGGPQGPTPPSSSSTSTLNLTGVGGGGRASAVAAASSKLGTLSGDVSRLCDRLLSRFVRRVTRDAAARVNVVDTQHVRSASVSSTTRATPSSSSSPAQQLVPEPGQVFDKLEQIFRFIGGALADVRLTDEPQPGTGDPSAPPEPGSLAGKLGEQLMDQVFDCVYSDCLAHIVQSSDTSWPTFDKILQLAERFQTNISRHLQLQVNYYRVFASKKINTLINRHSFALTTNSSILVFCCTAACTARISGGCRYTPVLGEVNPRTWGQGSSG